MSGSLKISKLKYGFIILLWVFYLVSLIPLRSAAEEVFAQKTKKVLVLANSTFHFNGGAMEPFNGYCKSSKTNFKALGSYGYLKSTARGQRISPFIQRQVDDKRIENLISTKAFDFVVLVTRYTSFLTPEKAKTEVEAFRKMHERISLSGARTVVSISYIIREKTKGEKIQRSNYESHKMLERLLNDMEIKGKKSPIILLPTGVLWKEGVDRFGLDKWFADGVHGTPLAQHASGCLLFTFITRKDPRTNAYSDLYTNSKFMDRKLSMEQKDWITSRVWKLYKESKLELSK